MFGVEETVDLLRGVPIPCWLVSSIVILSVCIGPVPVTAVHEFTAHRMQHFDLHGVRYGSRSALINMEAKGEAAGMLNRKCVVARWKDLTSKKFLDLIQRGAGAILVLLPPSNHTVDQEVWESWVALESELFKLEIPIPVYFSHEDKDLLELYEILTTTAEKEKDSSVASLIFAALGDYGYQVITEGEVETKPIKETPITTMIGTLLGQGVRHKLPTVALLAHYDAMGLSPSLSYGVDSNASGAAAIIELARLFSRLYNNPNHRPKYNLVFILSGGGKFNFFGTKAFLEEQVESSDSTLLSSADYTLCLDTLATAGSSNLFLHFSKPPKEGSKAHGLIQALNQSVELIFPEVQFQLIHKKVRLSEDLLAWEHERFSLKRLPAATISSSENHKDARRLSMFVSKSQTDMKLLARNVKIIAEGLARHIYNISEVDSGSPSFPFLNTDGYNVHQDFLEIWLEFLTSYARSPQLLNSKHPVVIGLEQALTRYTHEVTAMTHQPESGQEFVAYDITKSKIIAYRVKPAIFDLFLAFGIALYGFIWYFSVLVSAGRIE